MKLFNACDVPHVSGGTPEDERAFDEWLRNMEEEMRRRNNLFQTPSFPF